MIGRCVVLLAASSVAILFGACGSGEGDVDVEPGGLREAQPDQAEATAVSAPFQTNVLVSADFASSGTSAFDKLEAIGAGDNATKFITDGDMSYTGGSTQVFEENNPWNAYKAKTFPVAGNHEFGTTGGSVGEFFYGEYSGAGNNAANRVFPLQAGSTQYDFAYYSDAIPGWRMIFLNSNVNFETQSAGSQASLVTEWINGFRAANGGHGCILVALHQARWSQHYSGSSDNGEAWRTSVEPIWAAATQASSGPADLLLQAHVHVYEEFPVLDSGGAEASTGTKVFTVGIGGRGQVGCSSGCRIGRER